MDTSIYPLLDRMREGQLQQTALLQDIAERQDESIRLLRGIGKMLRERAAPSKGMAFPWATAMTGVQYLIVLVGLIYALKGGDLEKLVALAKAFGPS
jgi:hypothetical protein